MMYESESLEDFVARMEMRRKRENFQLTISLVFSIQGIAFSLISLAMSLGWLGK